MSINNFVIYGDSLSTGSHGENAYLDMLKTDLQIKKIHNFAVGSSGLTMTTPNSMVSILQQQKLTDLTPDIVFIWHGTNDWYWGSPLGSFDDPDIYAFRGAVRWSIELLRKACPNALIIWAAPVFRYEAPDQSEAIGDAAVTPNKLGLVQGDYTAVLREASLRYYFPLIETGIQVNTNISNMEKYTEDLIHPNKPGYIKIENIFAREIGRLWEIASLA